MRRQLIDCPGTRPMKKQSLHPPRRDYHSRGRILIDYYGTRTISPFPKKELLAREMKRKSITTVLEETTQRSQVFKRPPAHRLPSKRKKSTIHQNVHQNVKSTSVDTHSHKSQKNITNNCSRLRRRLQAANNPISNGLHFHDILRELLL